MPGLERIAVGSVDVLQVHAVSAERVRLEPLAPGTTPLLVWTRGGSRRAYSVTVRAR